VKIDVPPQIQLALMVVITWGAGKLMHPPESPPAQKGFASLHLLVTMVIVGCACIALGGCAPDIKALSGDPATVSAKQVVQGPMWTVTTEISRVNTTNTAASTTATGTAVNVPPGAVVNTAPAKPAAAVTTQGNVPSAPSGATMSTAPSPGQ